MTTTQYPTIPSTTTRATTRTTLRRLAVSTVLAGLVASAATTATAALAHAAGVSLDIAGDPVPVLAFAQMTFLFSLVGLAIAAGLRRWSRDPRSAWLRTTLALTVLSFVPDLMADAAVETRLTLMLTHAVAAAVVIPVVAARIARR